jgi:UDP-N-acetylmuramate--alanine ligase
MKLPAEKMMKRICGVIHFIGIGGIGMSGIAEILHNLGYKVQGSDLSENYSVERLRNLGIEVKIGHSEENITNASVIVKSTAVRENNPEIIAARNARIPIVKRSEMLAELMRLKASVAISGTHGKTTTTSLMASMFEAAGLNPTVINGGIINSRGTNAYLGSGDFLIAEADESDGTFIKVPSTIGIITNIDPEHLDYYGSFENLKNAFKTFIENLPFYGFGVLCKDHPEVNNLINQINDRKVLTYGIDSEDVDVKGINIRNTLNGSIYDVELSEKIYGSKHTIKDLHLPVPGVHNVLNSLAVIATAVELKFSEEIIISGFENFKGVKRRFTKTGEATGITVIDDYAHHPKEIIATLKTAKSVMEGKNGKVIAIAQPHRFTRVRDLFNEFATCFGDADILFIADIYTAGEDPIDGITSDNLVQKIKSLFPEKNVQKLNPDQDLSEAICGIANNGDMVICLGAGNITSWAYALPKQIEERMKVKAN